MKLKFYSKSFKIFTILIFSTLLAGVCSQADVDFCFNEETCCDGQADAFALADWNSCSVYYLCFLGKPSKYECPEGGERPYFNPSTKKCDLAVNVPDCVGGTRAPQTDGTTVTPTTERPPPTSTIESGGPDSNCTEPGAYYVPYPGDCSKYMICSSGILLPDIQTCPPGTLFDPDQGECNLENLVQCKPICPDSGTINLPYEKNCSLYWLCTLGEATLKSCPIGLLFDTIIGQCNVEDSVFCPNLCPNEGTINLPHARNCSLYWLCTLGTPTLKVCPPQLLFDRLIGQCNVAEQVDCTKMPNINLATQHFWDGDDY